MFRYEWTSATSTVSARNTSLFPFTKAGTLRDVAGRGFTHPDAQRVGVVGANRLAHAPNS